MALAALIAAYQQTSEGGGDGLRATLPLVGRTLVEHQARQAARAGAEHVVILVERLPAALVAAIDRLRRDGIAVDIARTVSDAADRVHPEERLLLIADGCVAGQGAIDRLAAAASPTLMTLADEPGRETFERIDGGTRWAGLALINGARLRETAVMLGDWDLQSTLLRRVVQEGAARISAFTGDEDTGGLPMIAGKASALAGLERHLLAGTRVRAANWVGRWIFAPVEEPAVKLLIDRIADPAWLGLIAAGLALLAAPVVALEWRLVGLILLILSGYAMALGDRLAAVRLSGIRWRGAIEGARTAGAAAALVALAGQLAAESGWGWWIVAAALIGVMAALAMERKIAASAGEADAQWRASLDGLIWVMAPFALGGRWGMGVAALTLYAAASFVAVQMGLRRRLGQ